MFRGKWEQNLNDMRRSIHDNKNRYTTLPRSQFPHPSLL